MVVKKKEWSRVKNKVSLVCKECNNKVNGISDKHLQSCLVRHNQSNLHKEIKKAIKGLISKKILIRA